MKLMMENWKRFLNESPQDNIQRLERSKQAIGDLVDMVIRLQQLPATGVAGQLTPEREELLGQIKAYSAQNNEGLNFILMVLNDFHKRPSV